MGSDPGPINLICHKFVRYKLENRKWVKNILSNAARIGLNRHYMGTKQGASLMLITVSNNRGKKFSWSGFVSSFFQRLICVWHLLIN